MSVKLATSNTMLITNNPIANNESILNLEYVNRYNAVQYDPRVHGRRCPHRCVRVTSCDLVFIYQSLFTKRCDVKLIGRFIKAHRQVRGGYPIGWYAENAWLIRLFIAS